MSRYIDADALQNAMYHEAFETDTEMQRWDSGCWIRYKLFENILEQQPTADVVPSKYGCGSAPYCSDVWEVDEDE